MKRLEARRERGQEYMVFFALGAAMLRVQSDHLWPDERFAVVVTVTELCERTQEDATRHCDAYQATMTSRGASGRR